MPGIAGVVGAGIPVVGAGCGAESREAQAGGALEIVRAGLRPLRIDNATAAAVALVRQSVAGAVGAWCALRLF